MDRQWWGRSRELAGFSGSADGFYEELIWADLVNVAERDQLQKAWICLLARLQPRNVALGNPAAPVMGFFGQPGYLAHGEFFPVP